MTQKPAPTPVTREAYLECEGIWKVFGQHEKATRSALSRGQAPDFPSGVGPAVKNVSFEVKPAETLVIMGLSGSGKSTLIRCITRLIEPTAGRVRFNDDCVTEMRPAQLRDFHRNQCAMVFQHFGLFPHRKVLENVAFGLEVRGVPRKVREERAREMLDIVGLSHRESRYPAQLSGGMKQRVGLARALAVDPGLLLFDEPFSALDPLIRRDLQDELIRLRTSVRKTMLFITHDMQEALKLGDRIAIMRDGEVVQMGTPEEIVLRPANEYVKRFVSDTPRTNVVRIGTVAQSQQALDISTRPAEALEILDRDGHTEGFVTDADGILVGAVTSKTLGEAVSRNESDLSQAVFGVDWARAEDDLSAVTSKLASGQCARVAVVDDRGRCVGAVDAPIVLRALVGAPHIQSTPGRDSGHAFDATVSTSSQVQPFGSSV